GKCRRVAERLVVVLRHSRDVAYEVARSDVVLVMIGSEMAGGDTRIRQFVISCRVESDGKSSRGAGADLREQSGNRGTVGSAAQEGTDARPDSLAADRIAQQAPEFLGELRNSSPRPFAERWHPVATQCCPACFDRQRVTRAQSRHIPEYCSRCGDDV